MSAIITIALSCIISEIKRDISPKIAIYAYRNYNGLAIVKSEICSVGLIQYRNVADRRLEGTDGQTPHDGIVALCTASRGTNNAQSVTALTRDYLDR